MIWCDKCRKHYTEENFEVIEKVKGKVGSYQPYRDTLETESYTYTEVTIKCRSCNTIWTVEEDEIFHKSETDMEKYGYKGANYGC